MGAVVALLGDINVDLLLDVPCFPPVGGDAVTQGQEWVLGGSASNTAVVLARLGVQARLAARVGSDPLAHLALQALEEETVDLSQVVADPFTPTGLNVVVITPDGERTMFASRGANVNLVADPGRLCAGASALHLSGYALLTSPQSESARAAVDQAHVAGLPITLDVPTAAVDRVPDELRQLLPLLDLVVLGESEACALTGIADPSEAAGELIRLGVGRVAVKQGNRGSTLHHRSGITSIPGLPVEVTDTTGAGDAFAAGMIHGLVSGLDHEASLILANTLGALATMRRGAGTQLPRAHEIREALRTGWVTSPDYARAAARALATLPCSSPAMPDGG
jgi:ribokinase